MKDKCLIFYDYFEFCDCGSWFDIGDIVDFPVVQSNDVNLAMICVGKEHDNFWCEDDNKDEDGREIEVEVENLDYCCDYYGLDDDPWLALKGKVDKIELLYVKYKRSEEDSHFLIPIDSKLIDYKDGEFEERMDSMILSGFVITVSDYTLKPLPESAKKSYDDVLLTIYDWEDERDFATENGVSVDEAERQVLNSGKNEINEYLAEHLPQVRVPENEFKDCVFRNFPDIAVEDASFSNCVFQNCGKISVEYSRISDCRFENCDKISLKNCNASRSDFKRINSLFAASGIFSDSHFSELKSDSHSILDFESIVMRDCTFRNFPNLNADGVQFYNCIFEDCGRLALDDSEIFECTFRRIGDFYTLRSIIRKSKFCELKSNPNTFCDSDSPIFMEDGNISLCSFEDVELHKSAWLCEAFGDCSVEHCTFTNCRTERSDRELFHCEMTVGKILKKEVEVSIVDEDTRKAMRFVADLDGSIEIGSFALEFPEYKGE